MKVAQLKIVDLSALKCRGTHFLQASVLNSFIGKSDLKDTVFFDLLPSFTLDEASERSAVISRPVVVIPVIPQSKGISTPKVYMKLDQVANVIPIRVAEHIAVSDRDLLNMEVEAALGKVEYESIQQTPIPQQLLKEIKEHPDQYPESIKILERAAILSTYTNAFFLPGGEDVPPAFYGQREEEHTHWSGDYRRGIFELAMTHEAHNKGIPLMGVCRGFQIVNIYFGAELKQHIPGHKGLQYLQRSDNESASFYSPVMQGSFLSAVFHHQGVPIKAVPNQHLKAVIEYNGIVKASEPEHGAPMILIQFHPEFKATRSADTLKHDLKDMIVGLLMTENNEMLWQFFGDIASTARLKRKVNKEIVL